MLREGDHHFGGGGGGGAFGTTAIHESFRPQRFHATSTAPSTTRTSGTSRKRGHKCCGGCCDVRRAVIIVNILQVLKCLLEFVLFWWMNLNAWWLFADMSASEKTAAMDLIYLPNVLVGSAIVVATSLCGLVGAIQYNFYLVGVSLGINFVVLCQILYLYPHVMLIKEIRAGIMTRQNYPNERQSCCCV